MYGTENGHARSGQGRIFVFASGVVVLEAGDHVHHKTWLVGDLELA